jgi:hypothetical protein
VRELDDGGLVREIDDPPTERRSASMKKASGLKRSAM